MTGKYPTYFRAPYSDCSAESGCQADVEALGYHLVRYDLSTEDYRYTEADRIQKSKDIFKEALDERPGAGNMMTLSHDIIAQTVYNLTEYMLLLVHDKGWKGVIGHLIFHSLSANTWTAVTVGTCLNDPVENWYRNSPPTAPAPAPKAARHT
jgi:hypothetical protein